MPTGQLSIVSGSLARQPGPESGPFHNDRIHSLSSEADGGRS